MEQHFLSRKLAHDQVTYSLIRVRDGDLAELHQRLLEGEADFATLASRHRKEQNAPSGGTTGRCP